MDNILVSTKLVKKILDNLDLSKVSAPDCILLLVISKCESDVSCILVRSTLQGLMSGPYI